MVSQYLFVANVVVTGGASNICNNLSWRYMDFAVNDTITIPAASVGNGGDLVLM